MGRLVWESTGKGGGNSKRPQSSSERATPPTLELAQALGEGTPLSRLAPSTLHPPPPRPPPSPPGRGNVNTWQLKSVFSSPALSSFFVNDFSILKSERVCADCNQIRFLPAAGAHYLSNLNLAPPNPPNPPFCLLLLGHIPLAASPLIKTDRIKTGGRKKNQNKTKNG